MIMQFNDEDVDYVLKDEDWLCTVSQVLDALKKKKINVCNVKQRRIFLRDLTFIRRLYL